MISKEPNIPRRDLGKTGSRWQALETHVGKMYFIIMGTNTRKKHISAAIKKKKKNKPKENKYGIKKYDSAMLLSLGNITF